MTEVIEIQRVGLEGQGVGSDASGNIYFVPGALPGDVVKVAFELGAKRYRDASVVEILRPSPDRREPRCPYFKKCGGCDWLDWDYSSQLRGKDAILRHLLERHQMVPEAQPPIIAAATIYGYRNRIQLRREGGKLGFFARRSHDIIDIEQCVVAHPSLNQAITELRATPQSPQMTKIELALRRDGTVGKWENAPHGAGGFGQIHLEQNERLRALVEERVRGAKRVLELYAGSGNLTFHFAKSVEAVLAVEIHGASVAAGLKEVNALGLKHVSFFYAPVNGLLRKRLPQEWLNYDTLVLDPPRAGAGSLAPFVHPGLKKIIFVSCSPDEFSKSLSKIKKDFHFVEAQAIDMFPQTRHIEFVATLVRA